MLPPGWLAALNDPDRQAALVATAQYLTQLATAAAAAATAAAVEGHADAAAVAAVAAEGRACVAAGACGELEVDGAGRRARALWCVGGVGVESLYLVAGIQGQRQQMAAAAATAAAPPAASSSDDAGSVDDDSEAKEGQHMQVIMQASDQLAYNLARQIAAANDVQGLLQVVQGPPAPRQALQAGSQQAAPGGGRGSPSRESGDAGYTGSEEAGAEVAGVLLAGAWGPNWAQVAGMRRQLQKLEHVMGAGCLISPIRVRVRGPGRGRGCKSCCC